MSEELLTEIVSLLEEFSCRLDEALAKITFLEARLVDLEKKYDNIPPF